MAATASIIIEVQDAQATAAMQRLNAQTAQMSATLQPIQRISEQTFNNIEGGALKARESAALLGEEFGVKVPRALRGVIAESRLLGPIFTAAFSGLAVLGFVEIVKQAVEQVTGFGEALKAIEKQNAELMQSVGEANKALLGPQTLGQVNGRILETEKNIARLNEQLGMTGNVFGDALTRGIAKYNQQQRVLVEELDKQKTLLDEQYKKQADLIEEERLTVPIDVLKLKNQARLEGLVGIAKINEAERGETQVLREEIVKSIGHVAVSQAQINEIHARATAQRKLYMQSEEDATRHLAQEAILSYSKGAHEIDEKERQAVEEQKVLLDRKLIQEKTYQERVLSINIIAENQRKELARQAAEETVKMQEEAAVAILPPWQRSYAQISIDTQNRLREIQRALDETRISGADAAKQIAAAWQINFSKMRDQLASDLETLFDNITSGNIGKYFLQQFKHLVFQMVASWILGMNQMKSASNQTMNGGGGILGAIFGGIFGGGNSGGQGGISGIPGVITNFGGGNGDFGGETGSSSGGGGLASGLFGSLGLSAGGGAGAGTTLPSGSGAGGLGGPLAGLFGKLFSHGIGKISGGALATLGLGLLFDSFGRSGGIGRALEGAAGGALTGFTIGGPIGALIGGIVGFLSGIFSHSTKKARLAIEANIKKQSQAIEDAYNLFQTDWSGSHDALEQLRQQGVDALRQAGVKDINRSRKGHVDQWIDKAEKEIDLTQAERNRRAAITFGPPEFRTGGFVGSGLGGPAPAWFAAGAMHFAGGGAVPAILHEGEFVMRPEAVARIGRRNLDSMNAGGSGGAVVINMSVNTLDKSDFEKYLAEGGLKKIKRAYLRAHFEGW